MRWILVIALLTPLLGRAGVVDPQTDQALCRAAMMDSGLPDKINRLINEGRMEFSDAPALLELQCDERSLMQILLNRRRAENLEYVVIDLGLSLDQSLETAAGTLTLRAWLQHQSREHDDPRVREFADTYLERFQDASFSPNLLVSAQ